ncbi:unnamed protein product [Cladocopium goreaui]|uniref:JmjC domain-containing protein n=1 Tax=Cladocopium goreaui TaxID=2562237 RepID=A0A9P1DDD0_9DINO|nr:unnamed protein product [Cladocopium goreaui]
MTVADYLNAEVSEWNLFFADMAYSLQRDVWHALREAGNLPLEAEGFDARPILSVGVKASSTRSHQHAETYQLLLSGLKAWWLAKPGFELDKALGDPCEALATAAGESPARAAHELPEEPWLCIQQVGEAVYFGDHFPHATCNLEAFVLGFGAQGLSHGWPALHRAAHSNDLDVLQRLVEEGMKLNQRHDQVTPLHRAVTKGHLAAVQRLVAAGAKLLKDREGKSPGTMAAERGDLPMLRFLAEAQPLKQQEAGQALIWAALSGHVPVMEFLLSQKASVHATDERGLQPIHFAALESDVSTVAFLVQHGANVSATGLGAERPIHWAAGVGHAPIIDYLLAQRADCSAADARGALALHFAAAQDRLEAAQRLAACHLAPGALQAAASKGHRRLVRMLLKAGAQPDAQVEEMLLHSTEL